MQKKKRRGARTKGRVRDLAHGGDAVVETEIGLVFAAGGVPGDQVSLVRVQKRGRVLRGDIEAVLEPSPERREASCGIWERCGGCPWMPWDDAAQRARKARYVAEALTPRWGPVEVPIRSLDALGYRSRARLAFAAGRLGYRARRSHRVVDTHACPVLVPELGRGWVRVREVLGPHLEGEGEIELALRDGRTVVRIRSDTQQGPAVYEAIRALCRAELAGVALSVEEGPPASFGDPVERRVASDGRPLEGTLGGFSQAHESLNVELVACARDVLAPRGARVLELHAGHGNFTVSLAPDSAAYVAIEVDEAACRALRRNVAARGLTVKVVCATAASFPGSRYDAILLDPPRGGDRDAVVRLAALKAQRLVYVSCEPMTLARDLAILGDAGWRLDRVQAFDMFPQTPHVEVVARLVR